VVITQSTDCASAIIQREASIIKETMMGTIRPARIEIFQHQNGDWGFRLVGGNGETVVSGEGYTRKQDAVRGVRDFKRMVAGADVVEKAAVASDVL
jgi:uncharacterized protein YegP (UPF0339 family)